MNEQHTPFNLDHPFDVDLLRKTLVGRGYVQSALAETMNLDAPEGPLARKSDVYAILRRTEKPSPYNTLVRLFILGRVMPEDAAREALEPVVLEDLLAVGLLRKDGGGVRAEAALLAYEDLYLLCDFLPQVLGGQAPDDFVLGIGPSTIALANMTVRKKARNVLDLGAGAGFQSIRASDHAERITATDINARALNFGALNARLSGRDNIEFVRGSLYEPVRGRTFDLVVCNPPFVISPKGRYQYRDSGMEGDTLCERIIRGAPGLLAEGGFCTVLVNWHHKDENDWAARPLSWLDSSGCDIMLVCSETEDPIAYASSWLARDAAVEQERFPETLDRWLAYYDDLGIGKISFGAVIIRRRTCSRNWVFTDRAPEYRAQGPCSDQILRIFAAQDILQKGLDLLSLRFLLTPDHELMQTLQAEEGIWKVSNARIRQVKGFPFTGNVDKLMATMLAGCNGERTLDELIRDLAAGLRMDPDRIVKPCVEVMGMLMQKGFLTVVQDGGGTTGAGT
ncbi:MAG TPA: methyltransferase [Deltaproteobacteria bacterium]|nr:methyltransferase [Deltaproteobacteria bacterium]HQI81129.1 methyltransferase [Deltaproteobacteria bacterium]